MKNIACYYLDREPREFSTSPDIDNENIPLAYIGIE